MTSENKTRHRATGPVPAPPPDDQRYVAWFHELDAWTEYWDIYNPQTRGRYYFGDGKDEPGLLSFFLPRTQYPPPWQAWTRMALRMESPGAFIEEIARPGVASAVREIDDLVGSLFARHFGDARDPRIRADYLEAMIRFAIDTLPPATERAARIPADDWRRRTAGRYSLDGDLMWFAWALQLEAAQALGRAASNAPEAFARRALLLAGVAIGCPANFVWRGHRRTRAEYANRAEAIPLFRQRGTNWATDFTAAAEEIHALYRIREWGEDR